MSECYLRKTERKRGHIYALILYTARGLGQFTYWQLTPSLTKLQAQRNCLALYHLGKLRVVRHGTPGHNGRPTIYAPVNNFPFDPPARERIIGL